LPRLETTFEAGDHGLLLFGRQRGNACRRRYRDLAGPNGGYQGLDAVLLNLVGERWPGKPSSARLLSRPIGLFPRVFPAC
jgi:hypothetical protein